MHIRFSDLKHLYFTSHSQLGGAPTCYNTVMRSHKRLSIWLLLAVFLMACGVLSRIAPGADPTPPPSPSPTSSPELFTPALPPPPATPIPDTATPPPTPTDAPPPILTPEPTPPPEPAGDFLVRTLPDGGLFVGDQVSFEVIPPVGMDLAESELLIRIEALDELELGPTTFNPYGIARRMQATLIWAWDTQDLDPGIYTLTFSVQPDGLIWEEEILLHPINEMPPPEPYAEWDSAETSCCIIHYVTGTEAERDLNYLMEEADRQAELAVQRIGGNFDEPIIITMLPRVLGHGGFAGREISISYLDRNYAGTDFSMVLLHEMIHILDGRLGGEWRPSMFIEGVAVYLSGGHFKPEPIMPRAAALLEAPNEDPDGEYGWFIALEELADEFYATQHEIGYLQAAALVGYMEETWGWDAFEAFYRNIPSPENGSPIQSIESALLAHFDISLDELERDFIASLSQELVTAEHIEDIRLTVEFYNTVRRYQRAFDPSAYFRTAWLLWNEDMRQRGIVADYLRRPELPENLAIENMLLGASQRFLEGDYTGAQNFLDAANAALDILIETEVASVPSP